MKTIIAVMLMLPMIANAWTQTQKALYLSAQAATAIDWAQTRTIAKNPESFQEANPLIGKEPSLGKVDAFMVVRLAINHAAANYIGDEYRTPALIGMNIAYWTAVIHNRSIGVKMDHADKMAHFALSAAIGATAKAAGQSETSAFVIAMVPGIAKELHDARKGGSGWSNKDMIANTLGAVIGIKSAKWFINQNDGQTVIGYRTEF